MLGKTSSTSLSNIGIDEKSFCDKNTIGSFFIVLFYNVKVGYTHI